MLALLALVPAYLALSAWWTWAGVEKVDLSEVMSGDGGATNYLVVGTDSREGLDGDVENAGVIFGSEGERTDTIAVLRVDGDDVRLLAIPRDLWVPVDGTDRRINAAFSLGGPELLIRTVQGQLGIGIDHYLEVDFAGFLSLVDALGTVPINVEHPAFDPKSGLSLPTAGVNELDSAQALAYVRSRTYTEIIDGEEVKEPTADLGRQQRQQNFLRTAMREVGATRNPVTLVRVADAMSSELIVDSGLGFWEATTMVRKLGGSEPLTVVLPTEGARRGQAAVLVLDQPEAEQVLAAFR